MHGTIRELTGITTESFIALGVIERRRSTDPRVRHGRGFGGLQAEVPGRIWEWKWFTGCFLGRVGVGGIKGNRRKIAQQERRTWPAPEDIAMTREISAP
jgi:hypothetical protein